MPITSFQCIGYCDTMYILGKFGFQSFFSGGLTSGRRGRVFESRHPDLRKLRKLIFPKFFYLTAYLVSVILQNKTAVKM